MSFDYDKLKAKEEGQSYWATYSDLFMVMSLIFLMLYVVAGLRSGTYSLQKNVEYQQMSALNEDLKQQIKVYNTLKDNYLETQAKEEEMEVYKNLMGKLDLLKEEAKNEKENLRKQARENEQKEKALNKYQQLVRNIINSNLMAKSRIKRQGKKIKDIKAESFEKLARLKKESEEKFTKAQKKSYERLARLKRESRKKLTKAQQRSYKKLARLKKESEEKFSKAQRKHYEKLARLKKESEEKFSKAQRKHYEKLSRLKKENRKKLTKTQQRNFERLARLKKESEEKLSQMQEESQQKITQVQEETQARIAKLKRTSSQRIKNLSKSNREIAENLLKAKTELTTAQQEISEQSRQKKQLIAQISKSQKRYRKELQQLENDHNAKVQKEKARFEAKIKKQRLSAKSREKALKKFKTQMLKKEQVYKKHVNALDKKIKTSTTELRKAKKSLNARKQLAQKIIQNFKNANIEAEVDKNTGDVILTFGNEYFDSGKANLKSKMRATLEDSIPIYASSLFQDPKIAEQLSFVEIVGFASPTYKGKFIDPESLDAKDKKAINYNLDLSYYRARNIFDHIFDTTKMKYKHQKKLRSLVKVTGRSFFAEKTNGRNLASGASRKEFCKVHNCKKSQRVIIKFDFKN